MLLRFLLFVTRNIESLIVVTAQSKDEKAVVNSCTDAESFHEVLLHDLL